MNLLLRAAGIAIVSALAGLAITGLGNPDPAPIEATSAEAAPFAVAALPATNAASGRSLIERSPFAQDRSEFSRNAAQPAPEIEVRLAGIFKVGGEMRASLVVGGQNLMVREGDHTPAGTVATIEASAVVIDGPHPRRIEMFKQ